MTTVRAVARALPPHHVDQETLIAAFRAHWQAEHFNPDRLEQLHRAVQVGGRHLALPLEAYPALESFRARNDAWTRVSVELGTQVVEAVLARAGVHASEIDHLFFVTVTGLSTPSVDARLMNRLPFRPDLRRAPIFGLGCVAGAAGLARVNDVLAGRSGRALLLSVELCSLTLQREDLSVANMIAAGLFGDGAAALLLEGQGRGPSIVATRSVFYPDTERIMGWDFVDSGFRVVLSPKVPDLVRARVRQDVDWFLAEQGLERKDIAHWIAHTGGPKVLEAFEDALELPAGALDRSWKSLREHGNLSSASVLFVLGDLLESNVARPGEHGLLMAMGPGFCAELVLLRW